MTAALRPVAQRLAAYWFTPMPADRLAVLRVLVGGFALWYLGSRFGMLGEIAAADPALYDPVGVARLFPAPMPPALYTALVGLTLALGVGFVLGWRFRVVGPLFAVALLVVMCYRNSWSMVYHGRNLVVLGALVLGLAPSADALSLDALRGAAHRAPVALWRATRERAADAAYGWPVRLLMAVTAAAYLIAGLAKVTGELGFGWAAGDVLRDQIVVDALRKDVLGGGTLPPLSDLLYDRTWLFTAMAVLSLALELGAPLALVRRKLGYAWSALAFGMHWGIFLMMGIRFRYPMAGIAFGPFLPVEVPVRWARRRLGLPAVPWEPAPPERPAAPPAPSLATP